MNERNAPRTVAALLSLGVLAACAGNDGGREVSDAVPFSEWDSAGVRIVESSGQALETALPWVVDTVPDLDLGQVEGDAPLLFQAIRGMVALPDGGVVVLNGGSGELRSFDASGDHVRTFGGKGQGPGEFLDPLLIPRFQADSLVIFDRRRRDFSWIAIDGSGERRLRPRGMPLPGTPRASAGTRILMASAASGLGSCPENTGCEVPLLLRLVDVAGTSIDTLAVYPNRMMRYTESGPPVLVTGVLDQKGLAAVGPEGPVVEGDPRFELRQFDAAGRLIVIFRLDTPSRGDPEDALDRLFPTAPETRRMFELMGLPEVLPAFQSLRVDRVGCYWAELFRLGKEGSSDWLVFDKEGRARGMVELPSGLEVHEIGENYILGRWIDDLGVEYVRRYGLDRSAG